MSDNETLLHAEVKERVTVAGPAYLTLSTLMCGFSFTGLVFYFGVTAKRAPNIAAACLLIVTFTMFLFASYLTAWATSEITRGEWAVGKYAWNTAATFRMLGILFLFASVSVMAFIWSFWVGLVSLLPVPLGLIGVLVSGRKARSLSQSRDSLRSRVSEDDGVSEATE